MKNTAAQLTKEQTPRRPEWLLATVGALITAIVASLMSLVVLAQPLGQLRSAWGSGDLLSSAVNVAYWHGFAYASTTQAGYPFGMDLNLVSALDITGNSIAALAALLLGSPFAGVNLLLALSFPAAAAATFLLLRMVGLRGVLAIAIAAAYAVIPYHWARGLGHVYLATLLPAVATVALALLVGRGGLRTWLSTGSRTVRVLRAGFIVMLVLICSLSGLYAATFALLLVGTAWLWRLISSPEPRRSLALVVVPLAIAACALIAALPTVIARQNTQILTEIGAREPVESVIFAGSALLAGLPLIVYTLGSRIPGLQHLNAQLVELLSALPERESTSMGAFGTLMTTAALATMMIGTVLALRRRRPWGRQLSLVWVLLGAALLAFIPWGLGSLIALVISPQVRAWNRLLPIILLLLCVGAAVVVSHLRLRVERPWFPTLSRLGLVAIAAGIVVISVIEAVLPFRGAYLRSVARASTLQEAGVRYAAQVNEAITQECAVLQLPYVAYPEQGVIEPRLNDYEHFWQVLTNPDKQWSYGSIRNTPASAWAAALPQIPSRTQQADLRAAGFCGIHLDRRGFRAGSWRAVNEALTADLGPPVATGLQGRWRLYDLRATAPLSTGDLVAGDLLAGDPNTWPTAAQRILLAPVVLDSDLGPRRTRLTSTWYQVPGRTGEARLNSVDPAHLVGGVRGWVQAPACGPVTVRLRLGTGRPLTLLARPNEPQPFALAVSPSEQATLTLTVDGAPCADPPGFLPWTVRLGDLTPVTAAPGG